MTDLHDGTVSDDGVSGVDLTGRWEWLADQPCPPVPPGAVGTLANRVMVYAPLGQVATVSPLIDSRRGGLIIVGPKPGRPMPRPDELDLAGPVLVDPAAYVHHFATPDRPFVLPQDGMDGLKPSLEQNLDWQLAAGYLAALTPTGYFRAGDTDSLQAAARQIQTLDRTDMIFVVALDISLVGRAFIRQTIAVLADAGCPVALVLGKQGDPLTQSRTIIPNLRDLAASVPLMPMRTDFNAFDLIAHGAFAGAIGTGGSLRHTVTPPPQPLSFNPGPSPSVLFTEVMCWWKGAKIAKLFGAVPSRAPRCDCQVCGGQRLTRFLRREDQADAVAHAIAVWSRMAADLLDRPTMRERSEYWHNICKGSVAEHKMIATRLQMIDPLPVQKPLAQWAELPAWPVYNSTPVMNGGR